MTKIVIVYFVINNILSVLMVLHVLSATFLIVKNLMVMMNTAIVKNAKKVTL